MSVLAVPVSERDHIRGNNHAPITLLEYGDHECPYCGAAYLIVEQLRADLSDVMRFVFRHFPLTQTHPHAESTAEAAEAAGPAGKFWEMHDILFTHQDALDIADLIRYAEKLRLDVKWFRRALETGMFAKRVREDVISGALSGVNGTPTFFINDLRYDGPHNYDSLFSAIENAYAR